MTLPIIEVDDLRVWCVIAEYDIQIAITINVDQAARIRAIGGVAEIVGRRKMAATVTDKHAAHERPMPSFDEQNV